MPLKLKNKRPLVITALFSAAIIWGFSFVILAYAAEAFHYTFVVAARFTVGTLLLAIVFHKKLRGITASTLWRGALMGAALFGGYILQTLGIQLGTTPGKSAFLTGIYCVLTPFLYWMITFRRPQLKQFAAAILCVAGIGLLSLNADLSVSIGDGITLLCGICFAMAIVLTSIFCEKSDAIQLTIIQLGSVAVLAWASTFISGGFPTSFPLRGTLSIVFLGVFAIAVCQTIQTLGVKHTDASTGSLILSLESVFGVLFSIWLYDEPINERIIAGFVCIFVAVVVSEMNFSRKKGRAK